MKPSVYVNLRRGQQFPFSCELIIILRIVQRRDVTYLQLLSDFREDMSTRFFSLPLITYGKRRYRSVWDFFFSNPFFVNQNYTFFSKSLPLRCSLSTSYKIVTYVLLFHVRKFSFCAFAIEYSKIFHNLSSQRITVISLFSQQQELQKEWRNYELERLRKDLAARSLSIVIHFIYLNMASSDLSSETNNHSYIKFILRLHRPFY